jgi:hypothetical protein
VVVKELGDFEDPPKRVSPVKTGDIELNGSCVQWGWVMVRSKRKARRRKASSKVIDVGDEVVEVGGDIGLEGLLRLDEVIDGSSEFGNGRR